MDYVYATSFNVKRTLYTAKVNDDKIAQTLIRDKILAKDLRLPKADLTLLKTLHIFLENPNNFLEKYFQGWKDTFTLLVEEKPAYHTNPNCEWFVKDFYGIQIPNKIKKKKLIKEARAWTKSNMNLMTAKTFKEFSLEFVAHFNTKYNVGLDVSDISDIDRPNSGSKIVNAKLENVEAEIRNILYSIDHRFSKEQQRLYDIEYRENRYRYDGKYANTKPKPYIEYKICQDLYFLKRNVLKPIRENVNDYIFLKLNHNHSYKKNVLETLNFRKCKAC